MRKGMLGSIATLLTSVGLSAAQSLPGPEIPTLPAAAPADTAKPRGPWMSGFGTPRPSSDAAPNTTWSSGSGRDSSALKAKTAELSPAKDPTSDSKNSSVFWKTSHRADDGKDKKPATQDASGIGVPDEPNAFDDTPPAGDKRWGQKEIGRASCRERVYVLV